MQPGSTQTAAILITSGFTKLESENSLVSICFSSCFDGIHVTRLLDQPTNESSSVPCPLIPICRLPSASRRNNLWTMLLSTSDNRWKDKEAPSRLRAQLNECWLERLPEGTKKIPSTNDFRFLGTFTIDRAFIAYLWISTICYLTLLIITVSRYKIVYNYRSYLILKTKVKKIVWMNLLEIQYI